jgi:Fe2+ or Zn2+ uptake regulation protein
MNRFGGECCDMRGLLGFLILFLLSKKPMHGQEIANELEKRRGEKPSPGTIYPALKSLKDAGFLSEEKEGKTITYSLDIRKPKFIICLKNDFYIFRFNSSISRRIKSKYQHHAYLIIQGLDSNLPMD